MCESWNESGLSDPVFHQVPASATVLLRELRTPEAARAQAELLEEEQRQDHPREEVGPKTFAEFTERFQMEVKMWATILRKEKQ
jgi:hypothetical protein